jgi:GNAT superfamily N-acetyltransferase
VLGTFFVRPNQLGPGKHVANAGYATRPDAGGRGVGSAMARASLDWARQRGFRAMQYNFVVSTNDRAVRLWQRLGFAIVGTVPGAFEHPTLGFVAVHVMYRSLTA